MNKMVKIYDDLTLHDLQDMAERLNRNICIRVESWNTYKKSVSPDLQAQDSISNGQGLMPAHGIDPMLGHSLDCLFFSLCHTFIPTVFQTATLLGQRFWRLVGSSVPPLGALAIHQRWSLQVPSSQWWVFWLRLHLLSPGSLSLPRSLGITFFLFFLSESKNSSPCLWSSGSFYFSLFSLLGILSPELLKYYQQSSEISIFKKLYLCSYPTLFPVFPPVVYLSEVPVPFRLTSSMICLTF